MSTDSAPVSCHDCNKESWRHYSYLVLKKYWNLATIFVGLVVYLAIGGAIFSALERPNELQNIQDSKLTLNQTRIELMEFIRSNTNLTEREAMEFTQRVFEFGRILAEANGNLTLEENPLWDWSSAVFFAITVVTTIGYGTFAPVTSGGQIFFLFYAVLGIPAALLFLARLGDIIKAWLDRALRPLEKRWDKVVSRFIGLVLLFASTLIFFLLIPAAIFSTIETWNYLESFYFVTVTLTTVGFGDFVLGMQGIGASGAVTSLYRFMSGAWLWIGLALVSALITEATSFLKAVDEWFCSSKNPICRHCCKHECCGPVSSSDSPDTS